MRRKLIEKLDVGGQRGACKGTFEQIMAEQSVFAHFAVDRLIQGVEVVNPFTGERSFAEQILIYIGHGRSIGIDSAGSRKNLLIQRSFVAGRQRGGDARLDDAIAVHDPAQVRVEFRAVQRVGHGAHQPAHGAAR